MGPVEPGRFPNQRATVQAPQTDRQPRAGWPHPRGGIVERIKVTEYDRRRRAHSSQRQKVCFWRPRTDSGASRLRRTTFYGIPLGGRDSNSAGLSEGGLLEAT
jgi:hypothetical protein